MQFAHYVWGLLHLDFGTSMREGRSAILTVLDALPTTLTLTSIALVVSLTVTVVIGALAASNPGGLFDRLATTISLIGASAPDFWVALVGILVFAVTFRLLPTSGTGGPQYWIMPVASSACGRWASRQVVRGTMISALSSPYVKTAEPRA